MFFLILHHINFPLIQISDRLLQIGLFCSFWENLLHKTLVTKDSKAMIKRYSETG